jgi:hypothetical protein
MYLKFEISTRSLHSLFLEAKGDDPWMPPDLRDCPEPHCALCGAPEYPYKFPLPHEWPRLYGVVTTLTAEVDGETVAVLLPRSEGDEVVEGFYLPVSEAEMLGDTVYLYYFCRYHGRPETTGWVDYLTNCLIEWFLEPSKRDLSRFNLLNRINYTLWTTMRFLGYLVGLNFIHIRLKVKRHPWQA